jgi:drug/metabolite transporter (DMT)-like permease
MSWFWYALLSATFFSASVLADKFLLTRYFKNVSVLALSAAAALAGIPFLIILAFVLKDMPSLRTLLVGLTAGWLLIGAYQIYYLALKRADTALITTLFQLILPFNFIIGITFFDERPTSLQVGGLVIVAVAAFLISLEEKEQKWVLRKDTLLLMAFASLLVSLSDTVFKFASESTPFLELAVSEYASTVLAGVLILILVPKVRKELKSLRRSAKAAGFTLGFNEALTLLGTFSLRYALVIGPLALIQGVLAAQPLITLLLTLGLGALGLKINLTSGKTKRTTKKIALELGAILLVCAGSLLLSGAIS